MTKEEHIAFLLYKDLEGKLSHAESRELEGWKMENLEHEKFSRELMDETAFTAMIKFHHPKNSELLRKNILEKIKYQAPFKVIPIYRRNFFQVAVAACIAALIMVGSYFMFFSKQQDSDTPPIAKISDVEAPKGTKAMITLADGRTVSIDSLSTINQSSVQLSKTTDGKIIYSGNTSEVVYNILTNPRGSKVIDLTFADGSHVWLNAGSSVTYPVAFVGSERKVSITGEAYFEVTHSSSVPFVVSKADVQVQVFGTHFNVNAYDDESDIKVTLLEGSVKVSNGTASGLLKPGQQAQIGTDIKVIPGVDADEVMAWKNGRFQFNKASLREVMRQIARWYDVEISYEGKITPQLFGGKMQRDLNLSEVLDGLAKSQVHFRIEGKKVIVMP